jgi:hypothetical protein
MELIKCGRSSNREVMLTPLDVRTGFAPVKKFLVYRGALDLQRFSKSLSESLFLFQIYSGRAFRRGHSYGIRLCDGGVPLTVEQRDVALPLDFPLPRFNDKAALVPRTALQPVDRDQPLLALKITLFKDGFVIGVCSSHVLGDGTASWLFLRVLAAIYSGETLPAQPDHDRAAFYARVLAVPTGAEQYTAPVMSAPQHAGFIARCLYGELCSDSISYEIKYADIPRAAGIGDSLLSDQDYIMAMIARDVASVSGSERVTVGSVYSSRRFAQFAADAYVGNAICARITTLPRTAWVDDANGAAAALRQTLKALTAESVAAEYRFFQNQYERGQLARLLPDFIACLFQGGVMMNNCTRFPMYSCLLDGAAPVWVHTLPPGLPRYASIFPSARGDGVVVNLKMPKKELARLAALAAPARSFDNYIWA